MNQKDIDVKRLIKALNQRPIAYYPIYRTLMGSVAGGVMLSQIMYCYGNCKDDEDEFEKNDADLKKETGLSEWELKNEKYKLRSLEFIKVSVKGVPATTYYKIDHDKFVEKISSLEHVLQTDKTSKLARRPRSKPVGSTSSKLSFIEIKNKIYKKAAPQNGAIASVFVENKNLENQSTIEPSKFDVLLDFWYTEKGEPNPGTIPPRYDRKKFTEIVAERINDGKTWREISAAVRNYWKVVKSPEHYYKHQGSISWFIAKGIDQFWDDLKPLENFKDRKNKNTNSIPDAGRKVIAPWMKRWNPLEQKGLVHNATTSAP